jgi:hypothetical protein
MTMTPIHRIPQGDSGQTLGKTVSDEIQSLGYGGIPVGDSLAQLIDQDGNQETLGICMDWAMQIRAELGISWGESIQAAMVLLYG